MHRYLQRVPFEIAGKFVQFLCAIWNYNNTLPGPFFHYTELAHFQKSAENAQILCNKNQNKTGQANFTIATAIKHFGVLCHITFPLYAVFLRKQGFL